MSDRLELSNDDALSGELFLQDRDSAFYIEVLPIGSRIQARIKLIMPSLSSCEKCALFREITPEVFVSAPSRDSAAGRSFDESGAHQVWLIYFFDGFFFLGCGRGASLESHRTASELGNYGFKDQPICRFEPDRIYLKKVERF